MNKNQIKLIKIIKCKNVGNVRKIGNAKLLKMHDVEGTLLKMMTYFDIENIVQSVFIM